MIQRLWIIVLIAAFASGCASTAKSRFALNEEFQTLGINAYASYAEYEASVSKTLRKNWNELARPNADYPQLGQTKVNALIDAHAPTNKHPGNCEVDISRPRGMLLIHGLYDSPYIMRDLEEYFRSKCFHTRSLLLPGHGTRPGSLLNIDYMSWVKTVNHAVKQFADDIHGDIYISGFSTGGALALKNALDHRQVKGLFLFSPALKVNSSQAVIFKKLGMEWVPFQKLADRDYIKYESITLDSVIEVGKLADEVSARLSDEQTQLDIPVMLVIAKNDYTIKTQTAIKLYEQGRFGNKSDMLIYAPIKVGKKCVKGVLVGNSTVTPRIPTYMSSCFIHEQGGKKYMIADYSHMALTLKSTDKHYGLEGDYKYCTQYFYDKELETRCKESSNTMTDICFGERKVFGSAKYPQCRQDEQIVRRLTSNPQFKEMTDYLDRFIKQNLDSSL